MTTFDLPEVADVLELPNGALHGFIQAGLLAVVELGRRRLVRGDAIVAFVPQPRRDEVRARLDAVAGRRRGGQPGFIGIPPEMRRAREPEPTPGADEEVTGDVDDVAEIEERNRAEGRRKQER